MQHESNDTFDPAGWLTAWSAAGGGYAGTTLLFPEGSTPALRRMVRELSCREIVAIAEHLGVEVELEA